MSSADSPGTPPPFADAGLLQHDAQAQLALMRLLADNVPLLVAYFRASNMRRPSGLTSVPSSASRSPR